MPSHNSLIQLNANLFAGKHPAKAEDFDIFICSELPGRRAYDLVYIRPDLNVTFKYYCMLLGERTEYVGPNLESFSKPAVKYSSRT